MVWQVWVGSVLLAVAAGGIGIAIWQSMLKVALWSVRENHDWELMILFVLVNAVFLGLAVLCWGLCASPGTMGGA